MNLIVLQYGRTAKTTCMKRAKYLLLFFVSIVPALLTGQCISGNCHTGSGVFVYSSGARYIGVFDNGEREGLGICYYSDGSSYFGYWKNDRRHGEGILTEANGRKQKAEWRRGSLHEVKAELAFQLPGNRKKPKTGCLSGDCKDGRGVYVFPDGTVYSGDFFNGNRHGFGECFFPGNVHYKGRWQSDLPDGNGIMVYSDDSEEAGYWRRGELVAREGTLPVRENIKEVPLDPGCIKGNCENGTGVYVYSDKSRYEGTFRNGYPHGQGKIMYTNGDVYEGRLELGELHGRGKLIAGSGHTVEGYWEKGRYVQSITSENPTNTSRPENEVRIWAVVIGIANYPHMPPLYYTDDDAYQFYAFLKSPEGGAVPDNQLRLLIDENATRKNIINAMQDVFSKAGPNDIAILYFSGHGKPGAFLPHDNRGEFNKIYHEEITNMLDGSPAKVKLCIADACHSGGMYVTRGDNAAIQNFYKDLAQTRPGCALILSSKSDETSLEAKNVRQGVFSHYMIRGLKGEADSNNDHVVTIMEVFNYVYHRVRSYTQNRQTPIIRGQFDRDMPVSTVRE